MPVFLLTLPAQSSQACARTSLFHGGSTDREGQTVRVRVISGISYTAGESARELGRLHSSERAGNFSESSDPVIDPETGLQFPGNIILLTVSTSPCRTGTTHMFPCPTTLMPGTITYLEGAPRRVNQYLARVDWQISSKQTSWGDGFMTNPISRFHFRPVFPTTRLSHLEYRPRLAASPTPISITPPCLTRPTSV